MTFFPSKIAEIVAILSSTSLFTGTTPREQAEARFKRENGKLLFLSPGPPQASKAKINSSSPLVATTELQLLLIHWNSFLFLTLPSEKK